MIKLTFLFSWALKFDLNSEPETRCYKKEKASSGENWKTMIVSILYSVMVLIYSDISSRYDFNIGRVLLLN